MLRLGRKNLKRMLVLLVCLALVATSSILGPNPGVSADNKGKAKSVIMLIPDGTSIEAITLARWFNGGQPLALDSIARGFTRTYWSNGPITDSAPGGTAYAIGFKTSDKHIGVLSDEENSRPVANLIEAARLEGKATGIVATSELMHATPADFSAHDPDRNNYNSLMKQQVYSGIDVLLAGGDEFFSPAAGGKRKDNRDLRSTIKTLGYDYVTTKDAMLDSKASKLWGAFAPKDLMYDLDNKATDSKQPTLAEMAKKALEILSKDKDGFFLMIEGSKVDWAAHANDPVGVVGDLEAFDKAVEVALDFARKDGHTVVVSSADHGTGGIALGSNAFKDNYSSCTFDETVNNLKAYKATPDFVMALLAGADDTKIAQIIKDYYGISNLKPEEIAGIKDDAAKKVSNTLKQAVSSRANVGWVYGNHTGGDVGLYNYAPTGVETLGGVKENTEVSKYMERVLGLSLEKTTNELFVNAKDAFEKIGATISIDSKDADNPVVIVNRGSDTLKLYGFSNIAVLNDKVVKALEGVNVCIKDSKGYDVSNVYVSQQAVEMLSK